MKINTKEIKKQSFAHLLARQSLENADKGAYIFLDGAKEHNVTFGTLQEEVQSLASSLSAYTKKGDRVLIAIPPSLDFIKALFSCFYLGCVAVPFYIPVNGDINPYLGFLARIVKDANIETILTNETLTPLIAQQKFAETAVCLDINAIAADKQEIAISSAGDDLALLLYTSGSTGDPKGVMLTHGNLIHNMSQLQHHNHLNQEDAIVTWLPNSPVAGLYTRLLGVLLGATTVIFPTLHFLQRPLLWLESIGKYQATFSAAPNFAYDLCVHTAAENGSIDHVDLSSWKMAISGGEIIRISTLERFTETFAKCGFSLANFFPYYGSTEGLCITLPRPNHQLRTQSIDRTALLEQKVREIDENNEDSLVFVSNGPPFDDAVVRIVDPNTYELCAEDQIGEVWVCSASNTSGYWQKEQYSQEICHAYLGTEGPFYRTGDLGFVKDDELYITGRLKELIILNGKNYYPEDIEITALRNVPSEIVSAAAFSVDIDDRESLIVVLGYQQQLAEEKLRQTLAHLQSVYSQHHSIRVHGFIVVADEDIPRASTRKIKRSVCRDYYLSGKFAIWGQSQANFNAFDGLIGAPELLSLPEKERENRLADNLVKYLAHILQVELAGESLTKPISSFGVDSIAMVKILAQLNRHFAVNIPHRIFFDDTSANTLAKLIVAELHSQTDAPAETIDCTDELEQVASICQNLSAIGSSSSNNIFVTGATGFLGSYLIHDLLTSANYDKIYCLVRANSRIEASKRLEHALSKSPGWDESFASRIVPVVGSIEKELLGLNQEEFEQLASDIDLIVHNAANVNFVAPYEYLKVVNVESCLRILQLATKQKLKPIHFVSTLAVFNSPERAQYQKISEDLFLQDVERLYSGYAQSKWVAERIFQEAQKYSVPVSIYRPGIITGDSKTGYCNIDDFLCRFIMGCIRNQKFPDLGTEIDMTPVDYASKAIVFLLDKANKVYHLANPTPIPLRSYVEWLKQFGLTVDLLDFDQWLCSLLDDGMENNELFPVLPFVAEKHPVNGQTILEFFSQHKLNYHCQNTIEMLPREISCPSIDDHLLDLYTDYFLKKQ